MIRKHPPEGDLYAVQPEKRLVAGVSAFARQMHDYENAVKGLCRVASGDG